MSKMNALILKLAENRIQLQHNNGKLQIQAPKGAMTPELKSLLIENKDDLLQWLQKKENESDAETASIQAVSREQQLPLSFAQQRLWFLDKFENGSTAYNMPFAFRLRGNLNKTALNQALNEVVQRHESLRTVFAEEQDEPRQKIQTNATFSLKEVDLSAEPEEKKEEGIIATIESELNHSFDLSNDLMIRGTLLTLSSDEYALVLTMHHIASDGWSIAVLNREVFQLYQAFNRGEESPLPPLAVQYADYSWWQRKGLNEKRVQQDLEYWKQQLNGIPEVHNIPTDRQRPAKIDYQGDVFSYHIPKELTQKVVTFGQKQDSTLFMVLHAVLATLLARYSGERDIVIGSPTAGRTLEEVEPLIGFFVNTMVLRADLSENPEFVDFLKTIKQTNLDAFERQSTSFEHLVELLKPGRSMAHSPLFQVMLILQNNEQAKLSLPGIESEIIPLPAKVAKFDLTLSCTEEEEGLTIDFEYATSLFDQQTIARMAGHLETLLRSIVENPNQTVGELSILPKEERKGLLIDRNQTNADLPTDKAIHELFEQQVEKNPDAVALVFEDKQLTYRELNQKANRWARFLIVQGVGPDKLVGVFMERSLEMVVALLSVMKAGGAYVPMDPDFPVDRLGYILENSEASLVMVSNATKDLLTLPESVQPLNMDEKATAIEQDYANNNLSNEQSRFSIERLSYVIYTSGSTGKPKGIQIPHNALSNCILSMRNILGVTDSDRLLAITTITFDISALELYLPLISGARCYVAKKSDTVDSQALQGLLTKNQINIIQATPATWQLLLSDGWKGGENLTLLCGGEALTMSLARSLQQCCQELWNVYGPTEATIWVSSKKVESVPDHEGVIPIGSLLDNTRFYVLDQNLNPVPTGVAGELHIAGDNLARGYHNRPELTQEKFIQHTFPEGIEERLYKTGDLVRWNNDGDLDFLGRIDHQVKIRGFRIELSEIETVLTEQDSVKEAVVLAREDKPGEKRLVAYIITTNSDKEQEEKTLVDSIKQRLKADLPDYMIPSAFMLLDKLPLTPNGKVDRKALPKPDAAHSMVTEFVAPKTEQEILLSEIWAEVLGVEKVGINHNFFEIGGHSLLAARLVNKVREATGKNIVLRDLFENQTIKELAVSITQEQEQHLALPSIAVDRDKLHEPFPLTDVQHAYWMGRSGSYDLGNVGTHSYIELFVQKLDPERFALCLNQLIQQHAMLRMVVREDGQQQILKEVPEFDVKILDLTQYNAEEGEKRFHDLRNELSHQLFTGFTWPLFDIQLTRFTDDSWKIHYSMDALVIDAGSMVILFNELMDRYHNLDNSFPPLELSFRDYVLGEVSLRETELYSKSKSYWQERLETFPMAPELTLAKDTSEIDVPKFERRDMVLDSETWNRLQKQAQRVGVTPTVFLLGVFGQILKQWTANPHFTLNLTLFNRIPFNEEVNQILGDFTSLTLLEMDYREVDSFEGSLKRLQAQLWDDLEHRYFNGVEVQRELSRVHGKTVTMPVVVTSTLGIDKMDEESGFTKIDNPEKLTKIQESYSITQTPQVWLDHQIVESNGELSMVWDSVEGLFPEAMLDDMFAAYKQLLFDLAEEQTIWQQDHFELLPETQKSQRDQINAAEQAALPESDAFLHTLFLEQAEKTPDALAILSDRKNMTYRELSQLSRQIAVQLRQQNVQPNELVGVVMEKGWEQVVACFAIMTAGGAYLPIDATYPDERIVQLLEIGEVKTVLTVQSILDRLEFPETFQTIAVDQVEVGETIPELHPIQTNEDLAYVIFTSGSTGQPKGVMIDHRGAVNTILDINERFGVTKYDRALALSSLSFDLSVYDLFGLLAVGGSIVIPQESERREPTAWLEYLKKHQVTLWNSVPSLMQMLVDFAEDAGDRLPLRLVMMSGDWIPLDLPDRIKAICDDVDVISLGGATEASIWSIYYPIEAIKAEWKSIPYGKPLKNQSFHVLKEDLTPSPCYVPGDLYIGGIGLAKGYWKDEIKTNGSFIIHPITKERLYKTGDLGRYMPDGNIEFLGRNDFQVKIQGYRIELGEIETVLKQHEFVGNAVVDVRGENEKSRQLTGYIVPEKDTKDSADSIGDLADSGNTIIDKKERSLFKLEEHGIRKYPSDIPRIMLSMPVNSNHLTLRKMTPSGAKLTDKMITLEQFSRFFDALSQEKLEELPLPKYFYPSAGSLYPIQTIVSIQENRVEGVEGGCYYYHPKEHTLVQLSRDVLPMDQASFRIVLIGNMDAIEPMYGKFARDFCVLEGGYISQLLTCSSDDTLSIQSTACNDFDTIRTILQAGENHFPIHSFLGGVIDSSAPAMVETQQPAAGSNHDNEQTLRLLPTENDFPIDLTRVGRKSYRNFETAPIPFIGISRVMNEIITFADCYPAAVENLKVYLMVKENRVEKLEKGLYLLNYDKGELQPVSDQEQGAAIFRGNDGVNEQAGFSIFFVRDKRDETTASRDQDLFACGFIGQAISNVAIGERIGLCAIGTVDQAAVNKALELEATEEMFHSFLGGAITQKQIERIEDFDATAQAGDPKQEIISFLSTKLPGYMVPKVYVMLDEIPLTANGKVDRKSLPEPEFDAVRSGIRPPRNYIELTLATIWKNLLKVQDVSIDDNFFEIGGNSILSMNMIGKIKDAFGVQLQVAKIFKLPTIEQLAGELSKESLAATVKSITPFKTEGKLTPLFIAPGVVGDCHYLYKLAMLLNPDRPVYAFQSPGIAEGTEPLHSIEAMAEQYVQEMLEVSPEGPWHIAGHSFGCHVAFDMVKRMEAMGKEVPLCISLDGGMFLQRETSHEESLLIMLQAVAEARGDESAVTLEDLQGKSHEELYEFTRHQLIEAGELPEYSTVDAFFRAMKIMKLQNKMRYAKSPNGVKQAALFETLDTRKQLEMANATPLKVEWEMASREPLILIDSDGEHTTMVEEPHVQSLGADLEALLSKFD